MPKTSPTKTLSRRQKVAIASRAFAVAVAKHLEAERKLNFVLGHKHTLIDESQWGRDKAIAIAAAKRAMHARLAAFHQLVSAVEVGTRPSWSYDVLPQSAALTATK